MKKIFFILAIGFISVMLACTKPDMNSLPTWTSDWLLPLVKGKLEFANIKKLSNNKISFTIPSVDLGFPSGTPLDLPGISISEVGPYKQPLIDWIHKINFDSLQIKLSFTNSFPITVSAGTKFSFRRSADVNDPSNIIYQHTVASPINTNDTYTFDITVNNNYISDTVYLYLEQFTSPGGSNITFANTPATLSVELQVIDINRVELHAGKNEVERDTIDISFEDADTGGYTDTLSYGTVHFLTENALPINLGFQIYFLDPVTNMISDSLMNSPIALSGCSTNSMGDPLNSTKAKNSISISHQRIAKIKKSKKAILNFGINTIGYPPPYVIMSEKTFFKLNITGDLHLSFNLNNI